MLQSGGKMLKKIFGISTNHQYNIKKFITVKMYFLEEKEEFFVEV
jgi:hypothetical protein